MKIPIRIKRSEDGSLRLLVGYYARNGSIRLNGDIEAMVDTGADISIISEADALVKMGGSFKNLRKTTRETLRLGGIKSKLRTLKEVKMKFKKEDGTAEIINMELFTSRCTSKKKEAIRSAQTIPSIIGMDFLYKNDLKLVVNPKENEAYFEKVE